FAVSELFREIAPKVSTRPGGYTRIIKTGNRSGDNAEMCMMELVDFNELLLGTKDTKKAKTTRRGRRKAVTAKAEGAEVETTVAETQGEPAAEASTEVKEKKTRGRKKKSDDKEEK